MFAYRFPKQASREDLCLRLDRMVNGEDDLVADIPDPLRKIIRTYLGFFQKGAPRDFDLQGASIGNLILTGGYLNHDRHLDPVVYLFGKLAEVRGTVRPITSQDLHLVAELADGTVLVGQHSAHGQGCAFNSLAGQECFSDPKKRPAPALQTGYSRQDIRFDPQRRTDLLPHGQFFIPA